VHVLDISKGFTPELGFFDERLLEHHRTAGMAMLDKAHHAICPAGDAGVIPVARLLREGDPASEIVEAADRWRADVIVIGTHTRGALERLLLGSTAEAVLRQAHCAVLTVRHCRPPSIPIAEACAEAQVSGAQT
jgi:nucleotide-binding universal stress UspA family protein